MVRPEDLKKGDVVSNEANRDDKGKHFYKFIKHSDDGKSMVCLSLETNQIFNELQYNRSFSPIRDEFVYDQEEIDLINLTK
jgi:hypothetical protein